MYRRDKTAISSKSDIITESGRYKAYTELANRINEGHKITYECGTSEQLENNLSRMVPTEHFMPPRDTLLGNTNDR